MFYTKGIEIAFFFRVKVLFLLVVGIGLNEKNGAQRSVILKEAFWKRINAFTSSQPSGGGDGWISCSTR